MRESWQQRIDRAGQLAAVGGAAGPLLVFYGKLLHAQQRISNAIKARTAWRPCGSLGRDGPAVAATAPLVFHEVAQSGSEPMAVEARQLLGGSESEVVELLLAYWRTRSDRQFFAKAIMQPYADLLAELGIAPSDAERPRGGHRCPLCGGAPQVSVLQSPGDVSGEGGGRALVCATCLGTWPFRRVLCPSCGEEDERKLGYFQSPSFEHLRLDVCETCGHYIKTVDLTRIGIAVPIVDEVAGAPLDLWARGRGFEKIELNLVGL